MIIHEHGLGVGSLAGPDPNGQSFQSPNQGRSGARRHSHPDDTLDQGDILSIESKTIYRNESDSAIARLGNAISFGQTQDAFLQKVQEALRRMGELSSLVQREDGAETERTAYANEFTQLQNRLKEIACRMSKAVNLFESSDLDASFDSLQPGEPAASANRDPSIKDFIANTADPGATAIRSAASASKAGNYISRALNAVTDMRAKVGSNLQRLCLTGEQAFAGEEKQPDTGSLIKDIRVAQASTEFARYDMLTQSGTAMLAQANALPASALRLLD